MTDLPKIMQFLFVFCRYLCLKYLDLPRIISVKKADTHNKVSVGLFYASGAFC